MLKAKWDWRKYASDAEIEEHDRLLLQRTESTKQASAIRKRCTRRAMFDAARKANTQGEQS